mmetsp:Transcript_117672/g.327648  ORF Transcript_117672/g.327648 Transcript_117672/m.327648 type:complete len:662 (+) Transcript_117672:70-2055(+)
MADDADEAEKFEVAMATVKRHLDREEFELALKLCTKAMEIRPDSAVVWRCRVFTLLSLSRWSEAFQACEKYQDDKEVLAFERAYCLYRLNRFQDALDALSLTAQNSDEQARRQRLEAQIKYRMGDYKACAAMYEKLYGEDSDDVGLLVNAVASCISGDQPREALRMMLMQDSLLESSYELCFNLACALMDVGRLAEAEAKLDKAKELCIAELLQAEDLTEEDVGLLEDHEELAAISVQRGCVLQRRGATEEAMELYNRVLRQRSGQDREVDVTVLAVACNNVVALRSEGKSLFDSLKRINVASKESLEHKLTRKQTIEIAVNKCLLLLQAHKMDQARRELDRMREAFPGHPRVAVVQAAIAFSEKKSRVCEETLQAYVAEHPGEEEVLLPLAQLYAQQHRLDRAVEALEQLPLAKRAQPHIAEAIAVLHQRQKSPEKGVASLREAIDFWAGSEGAEADEEMLASLLRIASRLAMQLKDKAFAAEVFQLYLEKIDGSDVDALCGLVQALASTDVEKAEQYAQRLRVPSYGHLDPEELEAVPIPKVSALKKKTEREDGEGEKEAEKVKAKRKRKRKPRWPKGFDPENPGPPPDPERWLPKHERTEYKKKMRKRDKNLFRGPQGSMPTDDNAFRKQGPSTAQVEVSKDSTRPSRNQGRKKQGKK